MGRDRLKISEQAKASQALDQGQEQAEQDTAQPAPQLNARQNAILRMQRTAGNDAVRRAMLQRAPGGSYGMEGGPIDDKTASQINSARSGGQTLDSSVADKMGSSMGADFSGVKVHTDSQSDQLNRTLNAKAFTTGSDIFFQQGAYNPGSSDGQQLLAHELTHVVQQGGSYSGGSMTLGPAGDSYENEAEKASASLTSAPAAQRHMDGEEAVQALRIQRHMGEEDAVQASRIQREGEEMDEDEGEDPVQASRIQREGEEMDEDEDEG